MPILLDDLTALSSSTAIKALTPLASNIDSMLVGPLVELLGLRLGGADVFAISTACSVPALRG